MSKVKSAKTEFGSVIEKLKDDSLENVMGGFLSKEALICFCAGATAVAVGSVGALGCGVAGSVCSSKSAKALDEGDLDTARKYAKAAKGLGVATAACSAGVVGGAGVFALPIVMDL